MIQKALDVSRTEGSNKLFNIMNAAKLGTHIERRYKKKPRNRSSEAGVKIKVITTCQPSFSDGLLYPQAHP